MRLPGRLNTLFKTIADKRAEAIVNQPLLNEFDLQLIQRHALDAQDNPFEIHTDVQHPLLGEHTSSYAGSGYEFAEHRPYVSGDDMRFIDWRVMARTGKLYRKVFHEERRPQLCLVVDRRAPMRFGTREQLKVTCAVGQAVRLAYQARQQNIHTSSVILEDQAHWLQATQSTLGIHNIIQQLNRPCPPQAMSAGGCSIENVLNELAVRLTPGCIIYLLSDFHDLDSASSNSLYQLARQHRLYARHILDSAEQHLPATGPLTLYDEHTGQTLRLDTGNKALAAQFAHDMQQHQQLVAGLFHSVGAAYRLYETGEESHG